MSAISIFLTDDAAEVFTDAATYDGDGRIVSIEPKAYPMAHLGCVVNVRGSQAFARDFAPRISRAFWDFEDLISHLALAAEVAWEANQEMLNACHTGPDVEIFVAGWSKVRNRAEAYVVASHDRNGERWALTPIGPFAAAPFDDSCPLHDRMTDDVLAAGLELMEAQRNVRDEQGRGGVGGFIQWSRVTRDSIHTTVVKRWPDAVGDLLGGEPLAA
ncbi:hypothetical protein [Bosea sp. (in: a-proteobacteria)]|jgi:hypothetical protein|uniref:hypothetical protein n=1 Tax=Bosea sp. (in: a-proteobacteria) TaxID=1871050 RepID=UPI003F729A54